MSSTTLIVSLLAFSLSTNARDHTFFSGLTYLETETLLTENTRQPSADDQGGSEGTTGGQTTITTGSRTGFVFFFQSFENDSFYIGADLQRAEGGSELCVLEDCIGNNLTVDDVNLELGWSTHQWIPFVDLIWSYTQTETGGVSDTHTDWDLGIDTWNQPSEDTKLKFKINGMRDNHSQTLTSGFQHTVQHDVTIGAF